LVWDSAIWDNVILFSGVAAEVILIMLLAKSRAYRNFPAFFLFMIWSLFSDGFMYYIRVYQSAELFYKIYKVQLVIDSVMIFALLVEVAWSVLRPIRGSLPKHSWVGIAGLVLIGALILWPIAGLTAPPGLTPEGNNLFRLQQTPALLRAVFFLALAAFSQVLSIGWRDRELQIASGLGFYSIVSLAIYMMHTHQTTNSASYHVLDVMGGISYLVALFYWVYAFATQTVERREFSPQMQSMLLAVAGAARNTRVALNDSSNDKSGNRRD
jgi:hypothetical protein